MRLFTAILPEISMRGHLSGVIGGLRTHSSRGRFVSPDMLHMTLVFLGDCEDGDEEKAAAALDAMRAPAIPVTLGELGTVNRQSGRLIWNRVEHTVQIAGLYASVCAALESAGFEIGNRPYLPHITLGRDVIFRADFDVRKYSAMLPPQTMLARRIYLMRSELSASGASYTPLYTKSLR